MWRGRGSGNQESSPGRCREGLWQAGSLLVRLQWVGSSGMWWATDGRWDLNQPRRHVPSSTSLVPALLPWSGGCHTNCPVPPTQ